MVSGQELDLRRVIEGVKINHLPSVMVFIDFRKAFDSIYHQSMFKILEHPPPLRCVAEDLKSPKCVAVQKRLRTTALEERNLIYHNH